MSFRNVAMFSGALIAGALAGSLMGPEPARAVAREMIELQRDVTSLLQGQKDLATQLTQDHRDENSGGAIRRQRRQAERDDERLAKVRAGRAGQQRSAPGHDVHAGAGRFRQSGRN